MKSIFYALLMGGALGCSAHLAAQTLENLVPNPGFEELNNCPNDYNGLSLYTQTRKTVKEWFQPTPGTTDYFHRCASDEYTVLPDVPFNLSGYREPFEGKAYAGLLLFYTEDTLFPNVYREYLSVRLHQPLEAGRSYCVSFRAAIGNNLERTNIFASTALGAYLSKDLQYDIDNCWFCAAPPLPYQPQIEATEMMSDTNRWYLISGTFKAEGGEQWLTIGNFHDEPGTMGRSQFLYKGRQNGEVYDYGSYYTIDDVSMYPLDQPPVLFPDTTMRVCASGLPTAISAIRVLESYQWSTGENTRKATLDVAGWYTLEGHFHGCLIRDSVRVIVEQPPVVDLGPDLFNNCDNGTVQPITLRNQIPLDNYLWTGGIQDSTLTVSAPLVYRLESRNACGTFSDEIQVLGCNASEVYFPNAIAPDSDQGNAIFNAYGENILVDRLQIFDVWGTLVYDEQNPAPGWDGRHQGCWCPPGVYLWVATWHTYDDPRPQVRRGDVTVVR